jgi:uncharacterized protein with PIN domain
VKSNEVDPHKILGEIGSTAGKSARRSQSTLLAQCRQSRCQQCGREIEKVRSPWGQKIVIDRIAEPDTRFFEAPPLR